MRTAALLATHPVVAVSMSGGRVGRTIAALVGVAAVLTGWTAFRRHSRVSSRPTTVIGIGVATLAAGVTFLLLADDGPGSGNGVAGSGAAVTIGVVAIVLGLLARMRRERAV